MNTKKLNSRTIEERLHDEMIETVDEELELEIEDDRLSDLLARMPRDGRWIRSIGIPISKNYCDCRWSL